MWRLAGIEWKKGLDRVFHRAGGRSDFAGPKPSTSTVVRLVGETWRYGREFGWNRDASLRSA